MQTHFFSGRFLSADALQTEQSYGNVSRHLNREATAAALAPLRQSLGEAVAASLPQGLLDRVALNPQPLPPREALDAATPQGMGFDSEIDMLQLQSLLSAMQQALSLAGTVTEASNRSTDSIAGNIK